MLQTLSEVVIQCFAHIIVALYSRALPLSWLMNLWHHDPCDSLSASQFLAIVYMYLKTNTAWLHVQWSQFNSSDKICYWIQNGADKPHSHHYVFVVFVFFPFRFWFLIQMFCLQELEALTLCSQALLKRVPLVMWCLCRVLWMYACMCACIFNQISW